MKHIAQFVVVPAAAVACLLLEISAPNQNRGSYDRLINAQWDARDYIVETCHATWRPNEPNRPDDTETHGPSVGNLNRARRLWPHRANDDRACPFSPDTAEKP